MANTTLSTNMSLPIPNVGVDPGPDYAQNINSSLTILDQHNHSSGSGVQINPSGININSDFPMNGNNLTLIRSSRYAVQITPLSGPSDLGCVYVSGVDLWFNDVNGNQIQITSGGAVLATSSGISSGTNSASFISNVLVVNSAPLTPANIQAGSILLGNNIANSKFLTLAPPNAMGANFQLTLPNIPGSNSFLGIDTSGNISGFIPQSQGITASNIANATITQTQIAAGFGLNPSGAIIAFGGAVSPSGWLVCDGSAVSRTGFPDLFAAIATNYGVGDGSTTFNIPDLRGQFLRGVDNGAGNDPQAGTRTANNGGNSGDNVGSNQASTFGSHAHTVVFPNQIASATGFGFAAGGTGGFLVTSLTSVSETTSSVGTNDTNPINVYVNFIIKT